MHGPPCPTLSTSSPCFLSLCSHPESCPPHVPSLASLQAGLYHKTLKDNAELKEYNEQLFKEKELMANQVGVDGSATI